MATQRLRHDVMGAMELNPGGERLDKWRGARPTLTFFSDVTDAPKLISTNMQHLNCSCNKNEACTWSLSVMCQKAHVICPRKKECGNATNGRG